MKREIAIWLQTNLAELSTDSFTAMNFASNYCNDDSQWQVAVELLYRCLQSELVVARPSIEYSDLSPLELSIEFSGSNPFDDSKWESISIWMTTYLEASMMCREIIAEHGLLNCEAALILSKGWEEAAKLENDIFPINGLNSRIDALVFSEKMRDLAIKSRLKNKNNSNETQLDVDFIDKIERIFHLHNVQFSDMPSFPIRKSAKVD